MEKVIIPVCDDFPTANSSLDDLYGEDIPNSDCQTFLNEVGKNIPNPVGRDYDGLLVPQDTDDEIQIIVINYDGRLITLYGEGTETIWTIKDRIQDKEGILADEIRLSSHGKNLEDGQNLSYYVQEFQSTSSQKIAKSKRQLYMQLSLRIHGGGHNCCFKFCDLNEKLTKNFSKKDPKWKIIDAGLNLRGICRNSRCPAKGSDVVVYKGMGTWSIGEEKCKCSWPQCGNKLDQRDVENIELTNCRYDIEGVRIEDNRSVDVNQRNQTAPRAQWVTYKEGKGHHADWVYLKITARPY